MYKIVIVEDFGEDVKSSWGFRVRSFYRPAQIPTGERQVRKVESLDRWARRVWIQEYIVATMSNMTNS